MFIGLLVATATAVALADQKSATAKIEQLGGQVMAIAKDDPKVRVVIPAKTFEGKALKDADLAPLAELGNVVELDLKWAEISDAGLAHLKGLTQLESLHLEKTKVTDAGLAHLKGLEHLQYLNLYGTGVTDAGLEHLKGLKKLKKLFLWETKVTEEAARKFHQEMETAGNGDLDINLGWDKEVLNSKQLAELKARRAAYEAAQTNAAKAAPPETKAKEVEVVEKPEYAQHIQTIFQASCVKCHGPEKQKAKLRLDTLEHVLKGAEDGPILVAGKADESKLYKLITLPADNDDRMPNEGDPLSASQIALIKNWINAGAK
jgi:mono/diheme cytochrome c family protein